MADHTIMARHPPGIVIQIVGTEMGDQGHSCEEHTVCGSILEEDVVVHLRKVQVLVEGHEETTITCYWVSDGIDCCHVGFLMRHMVKHAACYDGLLTQEGTRVLSGNESECSREEHQIFHAKRGCCHTTIISLLPEIKSEKGIAGRYEVKRLAVKKVTVARKEMGKVAMKERKAPLGIVRKRKMDKSLKWSLNGLLKPTYTGSRGRGRYSRRGCASPGSLAP